MSSGLEREGWVREEGRTPGERESQVTPEGNSIQEAVSYMLTKRREQRDTDIWLRQTLEWARFTEASSRQERCFLVTLESNRHLPLNKWGREGLAREMSFSEHMQSLRSQMRKRNSEACAADARIVAARTRLGKSWKRIGLEQVWAPENPEETG